MGILDLTEYHRELRMAEGYLELDMCDEAEATLEELDESLRRKVPTMLIRLQLKIKRKAWSDAVVLGQRLIAKHPEIHEPYIQTAYCLHETGDTQSARETLLAAPQAAHTEALFHYNLACYEAILGFTERACYHLEKSININPAYSEHARKDPDLKSLREEIC